MNNEPYDLTARGYLKRASLLLSSPNPTNLRYAALELRCCVETRQSDYLDAISWGPPVKVKQWETGKVAKTLRQYWKNPQIARIVYQLPDEDWETFFTPISKSLVDKCAKETGLLLHSIAHEVASASGWWDERRQALLSLYREAWVACKGEHIAMPLWHAETREMHPVLLYVEDEYERQIKTLAGAYESGEQLSFHIDYLDSVPEEWECDL